jgi:hypothetical protein
VQLQEQIDTLLTARQDAAARVADRVSVCPFYSTSLSLSYNSGWQAYSAPATAPRSPVQVVTPPTVLRPLGPDVDSKARLIPLL